MSGGNDVLNSGGNPIGKEEDDILARRMKAGDPQAREELILKNLSLVVRMLGKFKGKGVPDDVLYQEACYGLILAVDKYDPDNRAQFSTYAAFYIDKYLHLAMMENAPHPVALKYKASKNAKACKEAREVLQEKTGRQPSTQEIADHVGIPYRNAVEIMNSTGRTVSFDDPNSIYLTLPHEYDCDTETKVLEDLNEMCLDAFPVALTKREKDILYLRFGFGSNGRPHTINEIEAALGICEDIVALTLRDTLKKLRDSVS